MYFFGANWAAFSRDLIDAGGFDGRFGPGASTGATGQETHMQDLLVRNGVEPVYIHEAVVWHFVPRSRSSPEWALDREYRNTIASEMRQPFAGEGIAMAGIPIWLFRQYVELRIRVMVSTLFNTEQEQFALRHALKGAQAAIKAKRLKYLRKGNNEHG